MEGNRVGKAFYTSSSVTTAMVEAGDAAHVILAFDVNLTGAKVFNATSPIANALVKNRAGAGLIRIMATVGESDAILMRSVRTQSLNLNFIGSGSKDVNQLLKNGQRVLTY